MVETIATSATASMTASGIGAVTSESLIIYSNTTVLNNNKNEYITSKGNINSISSENTNQLKGEIKYIKLNMLD
jgi:hypothetical protein